jgi:hypothetical protein
MMMTSDEDWMDTAPAHEAMGTPFVANLRGDCTECQCGIRPGEMIQRTEDGYAHALCLRLLMRPVVWE